MDQHVPNQDGIAEREVDRATRWPAQEASYKVGEQCLLQLRRQALEHQVSLPRFHEQVLMRGPVPLPVLQEITADELARAGRDNLKSAGPRTPNELHP